MREEGDVLSHVKRAFRGQRLNGEMAYRHILVATDGSSRSRRAVAAAVGLARATGARVTAMFVMAEGVPTAFSGDKLYVSGVLSPESRALAGLEAKSALAEVARQAAAAGVSYKTIQRASRAPWRAILSAARSRGYDLIVMGSRGRGRVKSVLLGSQTVKVLAHSKVPVLVCR